MAKKRKLRSASEPEASAAGEVSVVEQAAPSSAEVHVEETQNMAVDGRNDEAAQTHDGEEQEEDGQEGEQGAKLEPSTDGATTNAHHNGTEENGGGKDEEEEEEEDVDEEPLEKLLEPFNKDQLISILKKAVDRYPDLIESVRSVADEDPAHRKIFVHGLGWDTTVETLTSVFGKYGEIEDIKHVTDRVSGKSKGYAFILFKHREGARKALKEPQKRISNRTTSSQLASAGPIPAPPPNAPPVSELTQRKIFITNVSADVDPQKLLEFFKQFGEIEDGPLGLDKQTGKAKGFALFVYKSPESVKRALAEPHKNFEGITLHCQRAVDGPKGGKSFGGGHHHHHHQNQTHHHNSRRDKNRYGGSGGGGGAPSHMMTPTGPPVGYNPLPPAGYNPVPPAQALNPALGQALTAFLATQGAGMGIGNLLGGIGGQPMNQGGMPGGGYVTQSGGGYGMQQPMPGQYQNPQMGQGGQARPPQGGYMGQ